MRFQLLTAPFLLSVVLGIAGCGHQASLTGKVTFSDDGSPVATGTICFTDGTTISRGVIQPDGGYVVGTEKTSNGLKPGVYQVYFSGVAKALEQPSRSVTNPDGTVHVVQMMPQYIPLIDKRYFRAQSSELSKEVKTGTNVFDISVDRYQPGRK